MLLLIINRRKSNTSFRLAPKSTTLDDLEGPLRTLFEYARHYSQEDLCITEKEEDRPTLSATKM